jgi:selenocysteine lyase/cysteine desulfurase
MSQNQKHLFSLPEDVYYLNCATMSPLLKSVEEAGIKGLLRKSQPYEITQEHFFDTIELVKSAFAKTIQCSDNQRIAYMGSVSYGMATVVKNILYKGLAERGKKIVTVGSEFPSDVYAFDELKTKGVRVEQVAAPYTLLNRGKIWNERFLESIDKNTIAVCLSPTHWADGTLFDLIAIGKRCREVDALFLIDFVVSAAYKWLLGPYGSALAYLSDWFDDGVPLEQNWAMRKNSNDFKNLINYETEYRPKAYRYNIGEMSNFISLPMVLAAIEQINKWQVATIQNYAKSLLDKYLDAIQNAGCWIEQEAYRSNHLFGIRLPEGKDVAKIQTHLAQNKVFVSYRGSAMRVSLHLWNDENDMDLLMEGICI